MANVGHCSVMFGMVYGRDTPAVVNAVVAYSETPTQPVQQAVTVAEASVDGVRDLFLPSDSAQLSYSLVTSDGRKLPVTPEKGELSDKDGQKILDVTKVVARMATLIAVP